VTPGSPESCLAGPGGGHRLHLPDVGGERVLQRPRADPVAAALPVVVGSADASCGQAKAPARQWRVRGPDQAAGHRPVLAVIDGLLQAGAP
jgi:hypothetical protein